MEVKSPRSNHSSSRSATRSQSNFSKPTISSHLKSNSPTKYLDPQPTRDNRRRQAPDSTAKFASESQHTRVHISPSRENNDPNLRRDIYHDPFARLDNLNVTSTLPDNYFSPVHNDNFLRSPMSRETLSNPFIDTQLPSNFLGGRSTIQKYGQKDVKQSNAYVSAMKALQHRIKSLEQQLEEAIRNNQQLHSNHEKALSTLEKKLNEERQSFLAIENTLKRKIEILEIESQEKQRILEEVGENNAQLRQALQNSEAERNHEVQKTLRDAGQIQAKLVELEERFRDQAILNEELQKNQIEIEQNYQAVKADYNAVNDKLHEVTIEKREMKSQYDEKLNSLVVRNKELERSYRDMQNDYELDIKKRNEKERQMYQEIEELKARLEQKSQVENELKQVEIQSNYQNEEINQLKSELNVLYKEQEKQRIIAEYSTSYAQDLAKQNAKLINSLMYSSKQSNNFYEENFNSNTVPLPTFTSHENDFLQKSPVLLNDSLTSELQIAMSAPEDKRSPKDNNLKFSLLASNPFTQTPIQTKTTERVDQSSPFHRSLLSPPSDRKNTGRTNDILLSSQRPPLSKSAERVHPRNQTGTFSELKVRSPGREQMSDRFEYENIVKNIIDLEKELLDLNRKYQLASSEMLAGSKDKALAEQKKKELDDLTARISLKNEDLLKLKKKEEDIMSRFKFN